MAHDVFARERAKRDVVEIREHALRVFQTGDPMGQVDLRDVAGHDHLRPEAEPREEHLHLLGRGVLRLVENDEAVVERAPAHERKRGDLDGPVVEKLVRALHIGHVVERIVERADVGIDLLGERARQKPQALARLDDRTRQDDAPDLLALERGDGHRHGKVGLPRSRRPDAEGDRRRADGVDVALLPRRLRPDRTTSIREQDVLAQRRRGILS